MWTLGLFLILYIILFIFTVLQETTFSMVFSLILVFFVASFFVIFLGFEFIGYLILIIYIGAIAVLFLFMVMLFDRAEYKMFSLKKISNKSKFFVFIVSFLISFFLAVLLIYTLEYSVPGLISSDYFLDYFKCLIQNKFISGRDLHYTEKFFGHYKLKKYIHITDIELIGIRLYNDYFLLLILGGLGLLVAMIGCIIITRNFILSKKPRKNQVIEDQLSRYKI